MNRQKLGAWIALGALAAGSVLFAGCGTDAGAPASRAEQQAGEMVRVQTARGEMDVPKNPKRVVVLDYGTLDTMDALGIAPEVLGVSKQVIPAYLTKYKGDGYKAIGNMKELDFEAISKAKPDLILMTRRQEAAYDDLAKIAPTVDLSIDHENYRASLAQNIGAIGQIFGREAEAKDATEKLGAQIDEMKKLGDAAGSGLFVMTTGGKLHAFGKDTCYGLLYDALDLDSVVERGNGDASGHGQIVSFEYIAQKNPAYILVLDRDAAIGQGGAGKATMDNALVTGTDAGKNGRIIYLDPGLWYLSGGGIESTRLMLDELRPALAK